MEEDKQQTNGDITAVRTSHGGELVQEQAVAPTCP